ncbi:hypothetical protein NRIC_04920 [Enterococcus florum]|uniref:Uncharacterized protein n=1 Tax=Enterococcus florum TaxID=2480627 RepID=A0A4P5P8Q4_9ENTE|nr:DUF6179 domain-containing protein [Enterococcus florum]GCF92601.1 hypothetical protein NRIC_04920 [Enterococcus florum]
MNEIVRNPQEFNYFLIQHVQKRLSGTSVISVDEIEAIRQSILFVLDHAVEKESVSDRFENGKQVIKRKLQQAEQCYNEILTTYQSYGIESFEGTLREIGTFFTTYDSDYQANVSCAGWIDYQLAHGADDLIYQGIDFISEYLRRMALEVRFLQNVPEQLVFEILSVYSDHLGFDYRKDINNLYQIIFDQWISKWVSGGDPRSSLLLTLNEMSYVYDRFLREEFPATLLGFLDKNTYYQQTFRQLQQRVLALKSVADLSNLFLTEMEQRKELRLTPPMAATDYALLMQSYDQLDTEKRMGLIAEKMDSPYDLLDYLEQHLEPNGFYLQLFALLSVETITGLFLLLSSYGSLEEDTQLYLSDFRSFIASMSRENQKKLDEALQHYHLGYRDFS